RLLPWRTGSYADLRRLLFHPRPTLGVCRHRALVRSPAPLQSGAARPEPGADWRRRLHGPRWRLCRGAGHRIAGSPLHPAEHAPRYLLPILAAAPQPARLWILRTTGARDTRPDRLARLIQGTACIS